MGGLTLSDWVEQNIILVILAFARIGTALIIMPGFGDMRVPPQVKIAMSMLITLCLFAALPLPQAPQHLAAFTLLLAQEVTIGLFLGVGIRLFLVAVHVLGGIVGYASGLSNAFAPPDANFEGANAIAALLQMALIALIFITNTHHIILEGIFNSYRIMPVGMLMTEDLVQQIARLGGATFYIAMTVGAPFFIFTVLLNLALGLANRVMPTMQVFFVAGPGLILLGLTILAVSAPAILHHVIAQMSDWLITLRR